jgi:hypothetical protein
MTKITSRVILIVVVIFLTISLYLFFPLSISAQEHKYCVAKIETPVLNTPDFASVFGGKDGKSIKLDKRMLITEMEFIALPGTVFDIQALHKKSGYHILKVKTDEYPYDKDIYIDSRFIKYTDKRPKERKKVLPDMYIILEKLSSMQGMPYMWGGNFYEGIDEMLEFYKPTGKIDNATNRLWRLEGVDCSGLLYQATNGYTPRNTSSLVSFGKGLNIAGLNSYQIADIVKPLDLIVWPGHVIIVMDGGYVIESNQKHGVLKEPLLAKLKHLLKDRRPADIWGKENSKSFVISRWYDSFQV